MANGVTADDFEINRLSRFLEAHDLHLLADATEVITRRRENTFP
jgi:hypothetical protein